MTSERQLYVAEIGTSTSRDAAWASTAPCCTDRRVDGY